MMSVPRIGPSFMLVKIGREAARSGPDAVSSMPEAPSGLFPETNSG